MLKIREAVIVEGRYDKIKLSSIVDAPIIETNGFRVFSDKEFVPDFIVMNGAKRKNCRNKGNTYNDRQRRCRLCNKEFP